MTKGAPTGTLCSVAGRLLQPFQVRLGGTSPAFFCPAGLEDAVGKSLQSEPQPVATRSAFSGKTAAQRELQKTKGYDLVHRAATLEERVEGALLLLRAWFDRSFANAIDAGKWRNHPSFEQFAAMMNPYVEELYPELAPVLAQRFGRIPGVIPLGQTYWPLN